MFMACEVSSLGVYRIILVVNDRWCQLALSGLKISCINFHYHLWASQGLIYYERHVLNSAGALLPYTCSYPSCLPSLNVNTVCGMYVKFWHLCLKQENQLIEWTTKGKAMVLRINVLQCNRIEFRKWSPLMWEKTGLICLGRQTK